jgi:GDP-L-fucose synthase
MNQTKRRILVTGATGLVGSAILEVAKHNDYEANLECIGVSSKDADLRDYTQVTALISRYGKGGVDGIIHLAANVGGLFKNMQQPVEMLEDNLIMNTNILKAAHAANINNVIMCLSTCIFPDALPSSAYPIDTTLLHAGPPHPSNAAYAHAKRMCDVATRAYQSQYNRRYFCVVPTNVYGPNDNFNLADAHVIPALIHKCWLAKQNGTDFMVAGNGTPLRQFIYSEDLARLILWTYTNYTEISNPFIACPPNSEIPISTVVQKIAEEFGYADHIVYDITKPNGQYKKTAQSTPLHVMDPTEYTNIATGLEKTIAWFVANVQNGTARV